MKGAREMSARLMRIAEKYPDVVGAAIYQEGQIEMTESKRRCPVASGDLRASGRVAFPVRQGRNISVTLSYGGVSAPYAIFVHENLEANHAMPPFQGGQAKFLESVLNESRSSMLARLAARVDLNRLRIA